MRIPMIVPNYSALGEWTKGGAHQMELAEEPIFNINGLNTRGRPPSKVSAIAALERMYSDDVYRNDIAEKGYQLATQSKFNWRNIAMQFHSHLQRLLKEKKLDGDIYATEADK